MEHLAEHMEHRPKLPDRRALIDIEALLIWTFHRQRAHIVGARSAASDIANLTGAAPDSIVRVQRLAETGGRVDGGGAPSDQVHPDADLVASLVSDATVIWCAETYSRPDCMIGVVPRLVPVRDARGRPVCDYEPGDRHRNYGTCRLGWSVSGARIARARAVYAGWHAELVRLAAHGALQRMVAWRVTGPRVCARPWLP